MRNAADLIRIMASYCVMAMFLFSCMSDREYQLRKQQLANQAAHQPTFSPLTVEGPIEIRLQKGGKVSVTAPNQPFREIPIPDGVRTQTELVSHLIDIGAISVLGWKSLDSANGSSKIINNNAGAAAQ